MLDESYIKLYRSITTWEWFKNPQTLQVFLYLLVNANFKEGRFEGITVKRGQIVTSRDSIAKHTGLSAQSVRTIINRLKSTNEITSESTNQFTIITIVKYNDFQDKHEKSTNESTNVSPNDQPATNQQSTTIEEGKKGKREDYLLSGFNQPDELSQYIK